MPEQKLISQLLVDDPDMRDIVLEFVEGLAERIAELRLAHEGMDWDLMRSLSHRLKGAGGSYGYPQVSEVAAKMEQEFRQQSIANFQSNLAALETLASAARAGLLP